MRRHATDTVAFDAFTKQWFLEVAVPEYKVDEAKLAKASSGWTVTATVRNTGGTTMPVEVAAARGVRFPGEKQNPERYQDARATITLGPKESRSVTIECAFEPDRFVVDPDVTVLMLDRPKAEVTLRAASGVVAMR